MAMRLANADVYPYDFALYAERVGTFIDSLAAQPSVAGQLDVSAARDATAHWASAAAALDSASPSRSPRRAVRRAAHGCARRTGNARHGTAFPQRQRIPGRPGSSTFCMRRSTRTQRWPCPACRRRWTRATGRERARSSRSSPRNSRPWQLLRALRFGEHQLNAGRAVLRLVAGRDQPAPLEQVADRAHRRPVDPRIARAKVVEELLGAPGAALPPGGDEGSSVTASSKTVRQWCGARSGPGGRPSFRVVAS